MKKRSLSGTVGIGVFMVALVCVVVAFATPAWLASDWRITSARLDKFGLWTHCFKSLPDPQAADAPTKFFVGCRWVYDPFTAGWSDIRGFLIPPFMVVTQLFFTICFLLMLIALGLVILFTTCWDPEHRRFVQLIYSIGFISLAAGVSGCIAVIVFACLANGKGWMPDHDNNYFSWSFALGVVGSVFALIAGGLFLVEANIQEKKRRYLRESQTRFQLESKS
ncbi:uncharacterized protein sinu isoform X2 [Fopius arisanus]|uniref:NKG7_0 protein n=1 Tax=Fopius arisanus TaxID=64838 RepID=A0A0C9RSK5_9HYME|nr:PREDICTED: uncharacterized protein LOC105271554 isoform X1 [Fopius arisanus]XP_011311464.1 PREDICTED: uncharacterized protein LOC105271554 isoform X2 [Fopius arisanus]